MSKEIKFRAWDKNRKVMLYPPQEIDSMIAVRQGSPDGPHLHIGDYSFPAMMTWNGHCYIDGVYQDLEWLQLTGLRDVHGKEIWEGDILKHVDGNYGYGGEYDKTHDGYLYTPVPSIQEMIGDSDWDPYFIKTYEVVGNIYEKNQYLEPQDKSIGNKASDDKSCPGE